MGYFTFALRVVAAYVINRTGGIATLGILLTYPFSWRLLGVAFLLGFVVNVLRSSIPYFFSPLLGWIGPRYLEQMRAWH